MLFKSQVWSTGVRLATGVDNQYSQGERTCEWWRMSQPASAADETRERGWTRGCPNTAHRGKAEDRLRYKQRSEPESHKEKHKIQNTVQVQIQISKSYIQSPTSKSKYPNPNLFTYSTNGARVRSNPNHTKLLKRNGTQVSKVRLILRSQYCSIPIKCKPNVLFK